MHSLNPRKLKFHRVRAFTLVEMLVVIAIMSILMTAGAIGLSGVGGKGVTSAVASSESVRRSTAVVRTVDLVARRGEGFD